MKRANAIGAKVHEMQFILARASLECLFDTASDSRALPQTKGGKRQVRPVVHNHRTDREMLSEIVLPGGPAKTEVENSLKKKKEGGKSPARKPLSNQEEAFTSSRENCRQNTRLMASFDQKK